jgi:DHA1 family inner membrane transport protein
MKEANTLALVAEGTKIGSTLKKPRRFGLYALTLGAFAIGTTEFVPVGLLPEIARDLNVTIPLAGFLVTAYALGVAVGAPVFTLTFNRVNRKTALALLLLFFIAGNALAAVAQSYGVLLAARLLAALSHGTFFGIGAIVAGSLVPRERSAFAVATMFMGLTVAMVMGVPFGAFVGQRFGWHAPFAIIAGIGLIALISVLTLIQPVEAGPQSVRAELRSLASRPVILALLTTLFGFGGVFTLYTYISPILETVTGLSPSVVAALLVLFGVGTVIGNVVAGNYADRALGPTLLAALGGLALVLAVSTFMWHDTGLATVATFAIGIFSFATTTPLQITVIRAAKGAPNLASSANISAFNIGNALGAALGAVVIAKGAPLSSLGLWAATMTVAGLLAASLTLKDVAAPLSLQDAPSKGNAATLEACGDPSAPTIG